MFRTILICFLFLLPAMAMTQTHRKKHHSRYVDTRVFAPTREAQLAQNAEIERLGLVRFRNDEELHKSVQSHVLVPVAATGVVVNPRLPQGRRYVLPWVNEILADVASQYENEFGQPLIVTSAVRTEKVQRRLLHWNRNAAPVHGEVASSHLTGSTVDIARGRMTRTETLWMENVLMSYALRNRVIVLEENGQRCFHIFVMPDTRLEALWQH